MHDKGTVLIVDDNAEAVSILERYLKSRGYETKVAFDGKTGLDIAQTEPVDLILLDVLMPAMNGYEVCQALQEDPSTADIVIIFMTVKDAAEDIIQGLSLGARDYILKPYNLEVVEARVSAALRVKKLNDRLKIENREMSDETYTDLTTGLRNRRFLIERLQEEAERAMRYGHPLAMVLLDVDDFDEISARKGQEERALLLAEVAVVLKSYSRSFDILARIEEGLFAAVLPDIALDDAVTYAGKIREEVESRKVLWPFKTSSPSVRVGIVASSGEFHMEGEEILEAALSALESARTNSSPAVVSRELSPVSTA